MTYLPASLRTDAASRGEYLNGLLLAAYLGFDFVDAADVVMFDKRGRYNEDATLALVEKELKKHEHAVIPGFYGSLPSGQDKDIFKGRIPDITGAIVAAAVSADLYRELDGRV